MSLSDSDEDDKVSSAMKSLTLKQLGIVEEPADPRAVDSIELSEPDL